MVTTALLILSLLSLQRPPSEVANELALELEKMAVQVRALFFTPVVEVPAGGDLQKALNQGGEVKIDAAFEGNFVIPTKVRLFGTGKISTPNGSSALTIPGSDVKIQGITIDSVPTASTNDLVTISGDRVELTDGIKIQGNGKTKRGVAANGSGLLMQDCEVTGIGRILQETQAVAMWDGTDLTIKNCTLQAGSTAVLIGGNVTKVPNHVPANILIEDSLLTHDPALRSQSYVNKTGFECKNCRNVVLKNTIIENVWEQGQTAWAVTLTPSQAGDPKCASPETTIEHVMLVNLTVRNVGGGINGLGFTQQACPTKRTTDVQVLGGNWTISRKEFGGHGSLMQLGKEPDAMQWVGVTVTLDGDAVIRTSDSRPIPGFVFRSNVVNGGGYYGIWTPIGSTRGATTWIPTVFPGIDMTNNTFLGAQTNFKKAFPFNIWSIQ